MKAGKRFGLTAVQKSDMQRLPGLPTTPHEIGRAFGKEHSSVRCLVSRYGGIAPAVRRRALLGALKKELLEHLRSKRRIRRSQHSRIFRDARGQIPEAISIRGAAEVEDRAIPGHWEGDVLRGSRNSHIATLVERHSRFTALVKVPSKSAAVVAELTRHIRRLPRPCAVP